MVNTLPLIQAGLLITGWLVFSLWCYRQPLRQWLQRRQLPETLVAYASEGGKARELAHSLFNRLQEQGTAVALLSLNQLPGTLVRLRKHRLLIIASTTGKGEAPLNGRRFMHWLEQSPVQLNADVSLLALGDRLYPEFCAFGLRLSAQLTAAGATSLTPTLCADRMNAATLNDWWQSLAAAGVLHTAPAAQENAVETCTFLSRELLNSGSPGNPLYCITLSAPGREWQAGDIAELHIATADGPEVREYSIASVPADQQLQLVVRARFYSDGTPGLGSGLLCQQLQPGDVVRLRLRSNPGFHQPAASTPLILIGNGSGIAGLRAHLRQRACNEISAPVWLIYGERHAEHDRPFLDELAVWLNDGIISRCDYAFSRSTAPWPQDMKGTPWCGYVQDVLNYQRDELQHWLQRGAAIMLCGSLNGMGEGVDATLRRLTGDDAVDQLADDGRYLRDLY